jgi:hypothetical protein
MVVIVRKGALGRMSQIYSGETSGVSLSMRDALRTTLDPYGIPCIKA